MCPGTEPDQDLQHLILVGAEQSSGDYIVQRGVRGPAVIECVEIASYCTLGSQVEANGGYHVLVKDTLHYTSSWGVSFYIMSQVRITQLGCYKNSCVAKSGISVPYNISSMKLV